MNHHSLLLLLLFAFTAIPGAAETASGSASDSDGGLDSGPVAPLIEPAVRPLDPIRVKVDVEDSSVDWNRVLKQSAWFLAIEHGFRWATEPGTRSGGSGLGRGYLQSIKNLRGWSDGDPFYVNYIGHPMQGAAASFIWIQNDRSYSKARFGLNRHYWKSRLRATGFSWVYSTQFEIGPFSEASVGYIQSRYPQQGLVDHVVTPAFGLGWTVAEDAVDRYLLTALERRIQNTYVRIFARGFLNPARSMANMLAGKVPFYREGRSIFADRFSSYEQVSREETPAELPPDIGPAPLEITALHTRWTYQGEGAPKGCAGGGAEVAFRMSQNWQLVGNISGCGMAGLPKDTSGDTLWYLIGPRWTPSDKRLQPYAQVLIGGMKLSTEQVWPEKKKALLAVAQTEGTGKISRDEYVTTDASHGFALAAGMGVDLKLNRATALKIASLEYSRSWAAPTAGSDYGSGLQLKLGVTLRMGTW